MAVAVAVALGAPVAATSPSAGGLSAEPKTPKPVVTEVKAPTGPSAGGSKVVIKGKHLAGARKVLFGTAKGTSLTVKSDRRLTVVSPAHAPARVAVRVVTEGGRSKRGPSYTFLAPVTPAAPTVTGVSPGFGPTAGGRTVTVTGAGLGDVTAVTFGGVPATGLTHVTPTTLTVSAPSHTAGVVEVQVASPGGGSAAVSTDLFTYTDETGPVATTAPVPADAVLDFSWLTSVDCPTTGECVAVGRYTRPGGQAPFAVHLADGTWTPTRIPSQGAASVGDVACTSPTQCLAVGSEVVDGVSKPFITVWDGASWDQAAWNMPEEAQYSAEMSVDCGIDECAVAGIYIDDAEQRGWLLATYAGGVWTHLTQPDPGYLQGLDLSCAGSLDCVAVAGDNGATRVQRLSAGTWTASSVPDLSGEEVHLLAVECAEEANCVAVGTAGTSPVLSRLVADTWSSTVPAEPFGEADLACANAGHCLSAGVRTGPYTAAPTARRTNVYVNYFAELSTIGVDSTTSADSLINDTYVDPARAAVLRLAACSAAGPCGAVGAIGGVCLAVSRGSDAAEVEVLSVPPQPGQGECLPSEVAADSDDTAVAVGAYANAGAAFRHGGLILSQVPLT